MVSKTLVAKFNVLFLGDSSVGKTSIITRFMHDRFNPAYEATHGVDKSSKAIQLVDTSLSLTLWQVSTEEGAEKASYIGVIFMETSAESGFNIKPLFRKISAALPETLAMDRLVSRGAATE